MTSHVGNIGGRLLFAVCDGKIGAGAYEHLGAIHVAVGGRIVQGRPPLLVDGVYHRAAEAEQSLHAAPVAALRRHMERRPGRLSINNVGLGASLEERFDNVIVAHVGGVGQCRVLVRVQRVRIGVVLEQSPDNVVVTGMGGKVQRTAAGRRWGVDARPTL